MTTIRITWKSPEEGGRLSGPPCIDRRYAGTLSLSFDAVNEQFSYVLSNRKFIGALQEEADIDFFVTDLLKQLYPNQKILLMEGFKVVGEAVILTIG